MVSVIYQDPSTEDGKITSSGSQILEVSDTAEPMLEVVASFQIDSKIPLSIYDV